jgi:SAM-dependent methyltransferase
MTVATLAAGAYDTISSVYDAMFSDPHSLEEDRTLFDLIGYNGGSVLDVGCGTGLFLDHEMVAPSDYVGIDPSAGMISRLKAKHPWATTYQTTFEDFNTDRRFDWVVSLYCSVGYIPVADLRRIETFLAPGGKLALVFPAPDYTPVIHSIFTGPIPDFYAHDPSSYGATHQFGNYILATR